MAEYIIEPVKISDIKRIFQLVEKRADVLGADPNETPISFEFLVGSLFPKIWDNMQAHLNQTYMDGYIQGREDALKEKEELNES